MVLVVTAAERSRCADLLAQMHRHRKRVFIDRFGWALPTTEGEFEIDDFDTAAAIYLLALGPDGSVSGSLRLLPTLGPHLLGDIFPLLCTEEPPRGDGIWEVSRFCTDPDLADPRLARKKLLVAMVEFALLYGAHRYTCVTHAVGLRQLVDIGWDARPLGAPQPGVDGTIGALSIDITPATLKLLRDQAGFDAPVLRCGVRDAA
jgi:acyl-homoserine lactone synthase